MSEVRHIDLLAAFVVTALEMAVFVFGMARVAPPPMSGPIVVRLVALPAPAPAPAPLAATPVTETEAPSPQPTPAKIQPLPAVPAAKPRPPAPRPEATHRSRQAGSPIPAPTMLPRAETIPTRSGSAPGRTMGARAIYQPMPEIPEELRHNPVTLIAVARFHVREDGAATVDLIRPTSSLLLNTALLAALKVWRFFPAMINGRPVPSTVDIRIPIRVR